MCKHVAATRLNRNGDLFCRLCKWIYIIEEGGCRWIKRRKPI